MKTGLLEKIMVRRYGQPITSIMDGMAARRWNTDTPDDDAVLYVGMRWQGILGARYSSLKEIYGDSFGGYLVKNSLKVAMLSPRSVYGLWNIDEFRSQPEVQHAVTIEPGIDFFMDKYMVLFYGVKKGDLYVFDSETDELDSLGPIESALETVLEELESALKDV